MLFELVQLMTFVCVQALSERKSISYTRYQGHLHHLARKIWGLCCPLLSCFFLLFDGKKLKSSGDSGHFFFADS